jgi:acyl-coenzyme A thioesterase PaaI-like protein
MSEPRIHEPVGAMSRHVLTQIGAHADDGCAEGLHLHLGPTLFDTDGHVTFGVLGAFCDLASSEPDGISIGRPFVHGDIGVHRVARPVGDILFARTTTARLGGRTAVVEVELVDGTGARVAYGSQQIVFVGPPPDQSPRGRAAFQRAFLSMFGGQVTLPGPLREVLGIAAGTGPGGVPAWRMPSSPLSRNGFGGLHGGVSTALVDVAACDLATGVRPGVAPSADAAPHAVPSVAVAAPAAAPARTVAASLRYLRPGTTGPFRAEPEVVGVDGDQALVRVPIVDEGADDRLIILGEARVALRPGAPQGA